MNFSVVLIARNEEKTLPRLIGSLQEFQAKGGEIILVDTGSTDRTAEVARELGCKVTEVGTRFIVEISDDMAKTINDHFVVEGEAPIVLPGDLLFDYASARNFAANLASNDMIATPDCDEVYTKLNLITIQDLIAVQGYEQLEYNFVFAHNPDGSEAVKFLHSKFYNRRKLHWEGIIHEVLVGDAKRIALDEGTIKLEHWQNPETNRSGYLRGLALDCVMHPEKDRNAHYLGRELMYTGRFISAIRQLERHIAMKKWPTEAAQSMLHIGECYEYLGDQENAISWYVKSFDLEPGRREPLMKLAELYFKRGSRQHVLAYANAALTIPESNFYANYQPYYEELPHELLYWALWEIDRGASKSHFDACLGYKPLHQKYLHDMRWYYSLPKVSIVIPTMNTRPEGMERVLASIKALDYPEELIETIVVEDTPRQGVSKRLNEGAAKATGDWIVYGSDDIEFQPLSIATAVKIANDNTKQFIAFNTGPVAPDEGNICEHFMIRKEMVAALNGKIFDEDFHHVGVDNLLWAKMRRLNQAMRADKAIIIHHHFSKGGAMDATYEIGWNPGNVAEDRALLDRKLAELQNGTTTPRDPGNAEDAGS